MNWISVSNLSQLQTPGLVVDLERLRENIGLMIDIAGDCCRLWPHVKTHKMREVVAEQTAAGIRQFKAATLAEAAAAAAGGAARVLLAHQPVGLKIDRFVGLVRDRPEVEFSTLVDNEESLRRIADACRRHSQRARLWIDVNCGMDRTGIRIREGLSDLRRSIECHPQCDFMGLHVYDGHIHHPSLAERTERVRRVIESLKDSSECDSAPSVIAGGTPTFRVWASETEWGCSPGTSLLWDVGYGRAYPELPFKIAAAVATSVVSKLSPTRLCLDLGYKSIASERPLNQRLEIPQLGQVEFLSHSEEHLVVESDAAKRVSVGEVLIAYPRHICPTVAMHEEVAVVYEGRVTSERWRVAARTGQGI